MLDLEERSEKFGRAGTKFQITNSLTVNFARYVFNQLTQSHVLSEALMIGVPLSNFDIVQSPHIQMYQHSLTQSVSASKRDTMQLLLLGNRLAYF